MFAFLSDKNNPIKLAKLLEKETSFSREKFNSALQKSKKEGRFLTEVIFEANTVPEDKTLKVMSDFYDLPTVSLKKRVISPLVLNLIPREISEQYSIIVFKKIKEVIYVASVAPDNFEIIDFIKKKTGFTVKLFLTTPADISYALKRYKTNIGESFDKIIEQSIAEALTVESSAEKMAEYVPIITIVSSIFNKAISLDASDIHIESSHKKVFIRFRIDGILYRMAELPKELLPALVSRIRILANLKIDEHMTPQDGRIHYNYNDQEIAVRVSIIPTLHGAKIALRLLEMNQKMFTLHKLGLNKKHHQLIKKEINISHGMILVTGPTGSGKTTTLYTLLRILNKENVNICTIEDPIEYGIDNINQMQIKPQVGLTFANGLKSLLRQDPNILMVGEIRDTETADIAVNAAMTGHLVLSTLHTNNAFVAPQRLNEIGVPSYLINTVINLVIGQRLVRRLCPHCKIKIRSVKKSIDDYKKFFKVAEAFKKLQRLELLGRKNKLYEVKLFRPRGCAKCNNTGYRGRVGIYEIIKADNELKKLILKDSSEVSIKNHLLKKNVLTMAEDGLLKVFNGLTTLDEVIRVTKD